MNSHDIGRDRGGVVAALGRITARGLVLGIDTDRLFPLIDQHFIARHIPSSVSGDEAIIIQSNFGHDGFLIEDGQVGSHVRGLLGA
jgi:homoserine O-acetyltransferase